MNNANAEFRRAVFLLGFLLIVACVSSVRAQQTTSFTYQGRLTDGGTAANGNYDLQFALFDNVAGGAQIGSTLTRSSVTVSGGVFSVQLDFGVSAFPGANRFLEIGVRLTGGGSFTVLSPRQQISSTPYAIRTLNAGAADALSSACVACVQDSQINSVSGNKVSGTVANATSAASAATATNASQLGGLPPSRFVQFNAIGNVGIGTSSPNYRLHIAGDNTAGGGFALIKLENKQPSGHSYWLYSGALAIPEDFGIYDENAGNYRLYIKGTNGNVGIGTTDPGAKLDVNGDVHVHGLFVFAPAPAQVDPACISIVVGGVAALGSCSSSLRYKSDVRTFIGGMDIVNRLRPISFAWKQDGRRDIGLAAEEVEKVTPLLTFRNGKGEIEGVRYNQLSAIFINAFREQQKEIELQHREITRLKKQVRRLRASSRPQRRDGDARNIRT